MKNGCPLMSSYDVITTLTRPQLNQLRQHPEAKVFETDHCLDGTIRLE